MAALSQQEIHNLAMNTVGDYLEQNHFEFLAISSDLKTNPQFICRDRKKRLFFVLVKFALYPEEPGRYDTIWMESMKKHAREKEARLLFASVGLANARDMDVPLNQNDNYIVKFNRPIEIQL